MIDNDFTCVICGKLCKSKRSLSCHQWKSHSEEGKQLKPALGKSNIPWNKGLTKNEVKSLARPTLVGKKFGAHISGYTDEYKLKISNSMKLAHKEGRAWNIGQSRWNNEPSWPEQFFMLVIENEFTDQNYEYEKPFHKFSLDFVWEHKKKVIEIDGEQHDRCSDQIRRDKEKDSLLINSGYEILRIKWKDIYNNPKLYIKMAKEFIN